MFQTGSRRRNTGAGSGRVTIEAQQRNSRETAEKQQRNSRETAEKQRRVAHTNEKSYGFEEGKE